MPRREYPKKNADEKRIVINFSLSGGRLHAFREMMRLKMGLSNPSESLIRDVARDFAFWGIDEKIERLKPVE